MAGPKRPEVAWVGQHADDYEVHDGTDRLRLAQQYRGLPQHGLVFRVEQRTTLAGRAVLLTPERVAEVYAWLGQWLATHQPEKPGICPNCGHQSPRRTGDL